MKIKSIQIRKFRRFTSFEVKNLPETARLIVLAGPNGSGKSSFFDALLTWRTSEAIAKQMGWLGFKWEPDYHEKIGAVSDGDWLKKIRLETYDPLPDELGKTVYVRSAYRNDPEFIAQTLSRLGNPFENLPAARMIDNDVSVSRNYQRLVSQAIEGMFNPQYGPMKLGDYRERILGEIRSAMISLFPDLKLDSLGNPLEDGTFRFTKGVSSGFSYKNLSAGEKAAFDLILDLVVARGSYDNTLFCIDEPEAHLNARLEAQLLSVLYELIPNNCQLMVATHSVGMMRKARDIEKDHPETVAFLDFGGREFDEPQIIEPLKPDRTFWEQAYSIALDDLAALVAPETVILCEGQPPEDRVIRNHSHDAQCYEQIFATEYPATKFISIGNDKQVMDDKWGLVETLRLIVSNMEVIRLIDRDDRSDDEIAELKSKGVCVLSRRNLESYLFDDEVLEELAKSNNLEDKAEALITAKERFLKEDAERFPPDDLKRVSGKIYVECKRILGLRQVGNDAKAFMRVTLAPLVKPGMAVYQELANDIFGSKASPR